MTLANCTISTWRQSDLMRKFLTLVRHWNSSQIFPFTVSRVSAFVCFTVDLQCRRWVMVMINNGYHCKYCKKTHFYWKNNFIRYLRIQWIHFPSLWLCLERFRLLIWSFSGEKNDYRHFETSRHKDITVIDKTRVKPSQKLERSWWLLICHRLWQC